MSLTSLSEQRQYDVPQQLPWRYHINESTLPYSVTTYIHIRSLFL